MQKSTSGTLSVEPYLQAITAHHNYIDGINAKNVCAIAYTLAGNLFIACAQTLYHFEPTASQWIPVPHNHREPIGNIIAAADGGLWLIFSSNLCHLDAFGAEIVTFQPSGRPIAAIGGQDTAWILTEISLWRPSDDAIFPLPSTCNAKFLVLDSNNSPVVVTDNGLLRLTPAGLQFCPLNVYPANFPIAANSHNLRDAVSDATGNIWTATPQGIQIYCAGAWIEISGKDGLPIEDIDHVSLGPEGSVWTGTKRGAARLLDGQWTYYSGRRWLLDDHVISITTDRNGGAWIATKGGITHIHFDPLTLNEKAQHYRNITRGRHFRDGFVTDCRLEAMGDLTTFLQEASDNDGLWTALWIVASSFRFAVTQHPEAYEDAQKSMEALLSLVRLTGIEGFPARAVIHKGERVFQSDPGPNWRQSPIQSEVLYKDDTSSDEVAGHFFAWYVYSELVATVEERAAIAKICHSVMTHILDHEYRLFGPDGQPTTWGKWGPEYLNSDPNWEAESGLGALELLSHLKVAQHLSPCARFQDAYLALVRQSHYALNIVSQKKLPPQADDNHSDDELAACAFYPLLQLEADPDLRRIYLLGFERTQRALFAKHSPFYNFVYGACTGKPCDAESALHWLKDAPMDLVDWNMWNSQRSDVAIRPERGRFGEIQLTNALRPAEMRVSKWNQNPFAADGGRDGMHEEDGTFWLLPYWMARYHGILKVDDL